MECFETLVSGGSYSDVLYISRIVKMANRQIQIFSHFVELLGGKIEV